MFFSCLSHSYIRYFLPLVLFLVIFLGGSLYLEKTSGADFFMQISPLAAIIPAVVLAWILCPYKFEDKINFFVSGITKPEIIKMCIIFVLAGIFNETTKDIGSVDSFVNFALSNIPNTFLVVGLMLISAFISTAIGTSMGAIAAVGPIAVSLSAKVGMPANLAIATVVGGSAFGDNLSIVSDTTIASASSQGASTRLKLLLNAKISIIAILFTIAILLFKSKTYFDNQIIDTHNYSFLLILPYITLILLACFGLNVIKSLSLCTLFAALLGIICTADFSLFTFAQSVNAGFLSVYEVVFLSLIIGGLSGLMDKDSQLIIDDMLKHIARIAKNCRHESKKIPQLFIAKIVSIFDFAFANNTIAIILSGDIARKIAKENNIPPHYAATWLDIFSCVFQCILPYTPQILLASAIAKVSPLAIIANVFYCYALGVVALLHILFKKNLD